jgi:hypothetical protein
MPWLQADLTSSEVLMSVASPSAEALALHQELVGTCRALHAAEHRSARLLARMDEARLHHQLGYASLLDYAERELELRPRKTQDLLRLGRALPDLPLLDAALAEGRLDWTKGRDLVAVLTADNEAAWVARAASSTSRELEHALRATLFGEQPPHVGEPKAEARTRITFTMDTADAETLRAALQHLRAAAAVAREDVGDGELLASMARRVIHDAEGGTVPTAERFRVVVQVCPTCQRAEGVDAELTDTAVLAAACDAEVVDLCPGPQRGHLSRTVPPAVRRAVLHRDRYRCRVPSCSNRMWLDVHHVVARARGGPHVEANLVTQCDVHHDLVHGGRLGVEVDGDELVFTFPDGRRVRAALDPRRPAPDRPRVGGSCPPATAGARRAASPG